MGRTGLGGVFGRQPPQPLHIRDRYRCGDRGRRAAAGRGPRDHHRVPDHDPQEVASRTRPLDRTGAIEPGGLVRQRHLEGSRGRQCRHHLPMVKRPDRRPDHQAHARQAADVWTRKARPPRGPPHRRWIGAIITKSASEPRFHAEQHPVAMGYIAVALPRGDRGIPKKRDQRLLDDRDLHLTLRPKSRTLLWFYTNQLKRNPPSGRK